MEKFANTIVQFIIIFLLFSVNIAVVEYMQKLSFFFQSHSVTTESINECQMYRK